MTDMTDDNELISEQRIKYEKLAARIAVGKASQQEATDAIMQLCGDNERLAVISGKACAEAQAAQAMVMDRLIEDATARGYLRPEEIRALAPADGLAMVQELRAEARENAMQALASMGQAQEAYEAQLEAEAELAAAQQREAALSDPICVHVNMLRGTIAKPTLEQIIHLYGVDALCKALMPVIVREAEAAIIRKGGTL